MTLHIGALRIQVRPFLPEPSPAPPYNPLPPLKGTLAERLQRSALAREIMERETRKQMSRRPR